MYESFYGLTEKPFNLTPDPRFLFLSEKHQEAIAHLLYGIQNRVGFVLISGEIGAGKTTICRTLIGKLEDNTELALVFNPCLSATDLLRKINEEFGIRTEAETNKGLIDELNFHLLDCFNRDKNCVLIIDEAQDLGPAVLEQIRLLSNLETDTQKLLQIVLIGQPELVHQLNLPELRQLNQRITARYHLRPLDHDEMVQYIASRLRVAGGKGKVRFTQGALKSIYKVSGGTPRMINAICDRALLIGYTHEAHDINTAIINQAIHEVQGAQLKQKKPSVVRDSLPKLAMLAISVLIVVAGMGAIAGIFVGTQYILQSPVFHRSEAPIEAPAPNPVAPPITAPESTPETPPNTEPVSPSPATLPMPEPVSASTLARIVDRLTPAVARNAAGVALLRAWDKGMAGSYPAGDTAADLQAFALSNGMESEALTLKFEQIKAINLPAFVKVLGDEQLAWVGLLGISENEVEITGGLNETLKAPIEDFQKRYLDMAVILWSNPTPMDPPMQPGSMGPNVVALQTELQRLGRLTPPPTGNYDAATIAAVKTLQAETGLMQDGIVGKQTRMVLAGWAAQSHTPSLFPKPQTPVIEAPTPVQEPVPASPAPAETPAAASPIAPVEGSGSETVSSEAPAAAAVDVEKASALPLPEASAPETQAPAPSDASATAASKPADAVQPEESKAQEPAPESTTEPSSTPVNPDTPEAAQAGASTAETPPATEAPPAPTAETPPAIEPSTPPVVETPAIETSPAPKAETPPAESVVSPDAAPASGASSSPATGEDAG